MNRLSVLHRSLVLDRIYAKVSSHCRVQQTQSHGSAGIVMVAAPLALFLLAWSILSFLSDAKVRLLLLLPG